MEINYRKITREIIKKTVIIVQTGEYEKDEDMKTKNNENKSDKQAVEQLFCFHTHLTFIIQKENKSQT